MNSQEYFNSIAPIWNHLRQSYFQQDVRPWIFKYFSPVHKIVADIGTGTGYLALSMAEHASMVFAIDQSATMLSELQRRITESNFKRVMPIHHDLASSIFIPSSLDGVTMNMSLHHMEKPWDLFEKIYIWLKDQGEVIISDVTIHHGVWAKDEMRDIWLGFSESILTEWLTKAGFTDIQYVDTKIKAIATSQTGQMIDPNIFVIYAKKEKNDEI